MNLHTSIIFYVVYGRPEKGTRANSWQSTLTLDKVLVPVKLLHARVVHSSCLACYVWLLNIVLFTTTNLNLDLQLFFRKLKIIRLLTFKLFRWIDSWFFIICIFTCDLPPHTHTHTPRPWGVYAYIRLAKKAGDLEPDAPAYEIREKNHEKCFSTQSKNSF